MTEHVIPRSGCFTGFRAGKAAAAVLLALFGLAFGCTGRNQADTDDKAPLVKVMVVEKKTIRPCIDAIGTLNPNDEVIISSEVDGILRDIFVDEGTKVGRNMVLARINDTDYRLNVANANAAFKQAEANLANLRIEHGRKEALFREKLVTIQQFDDISTRLTVAEHDLDRARFSLSLAQERLSKATIRSPKEGIVKEKRVTSGDFIRASMPILSVVQIDPLKLSFTITEKDVGALKKGQEITFAVDPFPGKSFGGSLSVIYPSLDERTRTLKAEAIVPNHSLELKPGFFARLKIYTGPARQAVVIPATSILYEGARIRAFVQEGNKVREKQLRIGEKYDDLVEVLDGLEGGEKLVVVGQNGLADGMTVSVESSSAEAEEAGPFSTRAGGDKPSPAKAAEVSR